MPPDRPRADSRARAQAALDLKCRGRTWQEVADELGFKSRRAAHQAVRRLMLREPPEDTETRRIHTAGAYRQVTASLFRALAKAEDEGDHTAMATIGRAIGEIQEKHAKLTGLHVPVVKEVDVDVKVEVKSTAGAVIDQAEQDLLAIAAGSRDAGLLPVIDAEVVSVE